MKVLVNGRPLEDIPLRERAALARRSKARLAEMFATGKTPRVKSDATFLQGHVNGNDFEDSAPGVADYYRKVAESHGQNTTGKKYMHGLARFPGDPEAWVSGRGDVERVCRERGWGCEGAVNVPLQQPEPAKPVAVAEDIVQAEVSKRIAEDPGLKADAAREAVIAERKPTWA
jgi:hypothetical protein